MKNLLFLVQHIRALEGITHVASKRERREAAAASAVPTSDKDTQEENDGTRAPTSEDQGEEEEVDEEEDEEAEDEAEAAGLSRGSNSEDSIRWIVARLAFAARKGGVLHVRFHSCLSLSLSFVCFYKAKVVVPIPTSLSSYCFSKAYSLT